jgi:hypothetical protein
MPDLRVLLVGGGPQDAQLRQLAKDLNIEDKVVFTGRVPHDQVHTYYDLLDVLVYPRLSMRLTDLVTPLKPLEAMAQGRILAASDVGGHLELIADGKTGVLFRADDPARWPRRSAPCSNRRSLAGAAPGRPRVRRDGTQLAGQRGALQEHLRPPDGLRPGVGRPAALARPGGAHPARENRVDQERRRHRRFRPAARPAASLAGRTTS